MRIDEQLAAAAAGDTDPAKLRIVAPDVSPDGKRAAALVLIKGPGEPTPLEAFFAQDEREWVARGMIHEVGAGEWDFGDLSFPYLSGSVAGGAGVELRLGPESIQRPVVDGWFLGVFWNAGLPWDDPRLEDDDARTPRLHRVLATRSAAP